MKIKYIYLLIFLLQAVISGCSSDDDTTSQPTPTPNDNKAKEIVEQLWKTSCLDYNAKRKDALDSIQIYADQCSDTYFKNYLKSLDEAAKNTVPF